MAILDQSFSAQNFEVIFNMLNRKGKVDITRMSTDYQQAVADMKNTYAQIRDQKRVKRSDWTNDDKSRFDSLNTGLKDLNKRKIDALRANLQAIADTVNSRVFRFVMNKHQYDGHEEFTIEKTSLAVDYAICQLQYNIKQTFQLETAGRHTIMLSLKRLLNTKSPLYIIRTDVSGFFESISQDMLYKKLNDNSLLSYKSKAFIKAIMQEFEEIKDINIISKDLGIPRGVGISSMLSEIFMKDIDRLIKTRREVIYYVRYVDDIFILLSSIHPFDSIEDYYADLTMLFSDYGLTLKSITDTKCQLIDYVKVRPSSKNFEYLGYRLELRYSRTGLELKYGLSQRKKDKIKERIDNAFTHYENLSKISIKQARRDLLDSLKLITGNIRLHNSKSGIKTGLYYNNNLIDEIGLVDLDILTRYLHGKILNVYADAFVSINNMDDFSRKLQDRINNIDLRQCWLQRCMYDLPVTRVSDIMIWL